MVIDYLAYSMEDMVTIFIKVDEKRHPLDEALAHYLASKKSIDQSLKSLLGKLRTSVSQDEIMSISHIFRTNTVTLTIHAQRNTAMPQPLLTSSGQCGRKRAYPIVQTHAGRLGIQCTRSLGSVGRTATPRSGAVDFSFSPGASATVHRSICTLQARAMQRWQQAKRSDMGVTRVICNGHWNRSMNVILD
jgi:hypothetical protein